LCLCRNLRALALHTSLVLSWTLSHLENDDQMANYKIAKSFWTNRRYYWLRFGV
jgi:hypothetical protein